jgi:hypothetical protein
LKIRECLFVAALLLSAVPLFGGIRYEFTETTRTEETGQGTHMVARAVIEGGMSRLDILSGNRYEPGSFILSHGDNHIYMVNPAQKSYVELETGQRINPDRVTITDLKSSFTEVPQTELSIIAGYPTRHYRLTLSYRIEVRMGTIPIRQYIDTTIEKWTTGAFDHVIEQYRSNVDELKTGNPEIDALIEAEATRFKGLALRERTQIVSRSEKKSKGGNVNLPSSRKRTKDMVVSSIEEVAVSPNFFAIPVDYTGGQPTRPPGTTTQYLTMQPDGP